MTDPRLEDHLVGVELQLVELVEQEQRAEAQGRADDAARLEHQVEALQFELAATAEALSGGDPHEAVGPPPQPDVQAPSARELLDHS